MTPRKHWPEEAEWSRIAVIGMLGKLILICVVLSTKTKELDVLAALSLMIAILKLCQDWLKEAKEGGVPTEINERINKLLAKYQ